MIFNSKSRVCVLTELYYPEETSTGYILTQICEALASDYQVTVITGPLSKSFCKADFPDEETHNLVRIFRCSGSSFSKDSLLGRIFNIFTRTVTLFCKGFNYCKQNEILFVVTNPPTLPVAAYLISKLRRCRYVLIVHDLYPDVLDVTGYGNVVPGLNFVWRKLNQLIYRNASIIIVLGRDMAYRIKSNYLSPDHDDDQNRLVCICNWAEVDTVFPDEKSNNFLIQELEISQKIVILYAGNLGRTHGVEVFAAAMVALRDRSDIHFLTIAVGKKRPWLQQFIHENSLENTTLIPLEKRPRSEQNVSLNAGDIAIITFIPGMAGISVPSRMYNCMAAGKPIIAVADAESELARVIREENVGWVVPPDNVEGLVRTIEFAANNPQQCREMGLRAASVARSKYTFEQTIAGYQNVLKTLISEH